MSRPGFAFHPGVKGDIEEAWLWYDERNPAAASKFVEAIEATYERIAERPDMPAVYFDRYKRSFLEGFPYAVVYRHLPEGSVRVLSVAAFAKRPGFWLSRV